MELCGKLEQINLMYIFSTGKSDSVSVKSLLEQPSKMS